ncbi:Hypothetical predicted protein [Lecanosticta acicola]|uniref:Carboxylic ester hydrolase n=1 Tax=Lecanosticta acicola TaxID=111012 RepID=A0AAI8YZF5_9PEZI|nr:Hypothetical predicted protein [Lecanosticta acicola]
MAARLSLLGLLACARSSLAASCDPETFKDVASDVFGVQAVEILAKEVTKWNEYETSFPALPPLPIHPPPPVSFCNVTVLYTHPGLNDTIRATTWLPLKDWNHRFLGQGGGGWCAGHEGALAYGVALGFASVNTDSGHSYFGDLPQAALDSSTWGLTSPGNTNLNSLCNFGYRSLDEMTVIGKRATEAFYGEPVTYSYWNGCSTGGRQGLVLAQRYPKHYQGIISAAPAINWVTFLVTEFWPQIVMKQQNYYPPTCELDAITQAAIEECDGLDGVIDGIIAAHGQCRFNADSVLGKEFECGKEKRKISKEAVEVAKATWQGPRLGDYPVWFGLAHEASLHGVEPMLRGLASTDCDEKNQNCKGAPFAISADWIKHWVLKDPSYDLSTIDEVMFYEILRDSRQQYHSFIDNADADLHYFKAAGGKIIHWHGLADQLIPSNGSLNYYQRVKATVADVDDFYRYYEVPGVAHCAGGVGAIPVFAITELMAWVETGQKPDMLEGIRTPGMAGAPGPQIKRNICPWPKVGKYKGGDERLLSSYECADEFGKAATKDKKHDEL